MTNVMGFCLIYKFDSNLVIIEGYFADCCVHVHVQIHVYGRKDFFVLIISTWVTSCKLGDRINVQNAEQSDRHKTVTFPIIIKKLKTCVIIVVARNSAQQNAYCDGLFLKKGLT